MKIVYRVTEEDFMEARYLFVKNEKWGSALVAPDHAMDGRFNNIVQHRDFRFW